MKYFYFTLIISGLVLMGINTALASEEPGLDVCQHCGNIDLNTGQKAAVFVQRSVYKLKLALAGLSEQIQEGSDQFAEELKVKADEESKAWKENFFRWAKEATKNALKKWWNNRVNEMKGFAEKLLSPPKKWIQRGSGKVRGWFGK